MQVTCTARVMEKICLRGTKCLSNPQTTMFYLNLFSYIQLKAVCDHGLHSKCLAGQTGLNLRHFHHLPTV